MHSPGHEGHGRHQDHSHERTELEAITRTSKCEVKPLHTRSGPSNGKLPPVGQVAGSASHHTHACCSLAFAQQCGGPPMLNDGQINHLAFMQCPRHYPSRSAPAEHQPQIQRTSPCPPNGIHYLPSARNSTATLSLKNERSCPFWPMLCKGHQFYSLLCSDVVTGSASLRHENCRGGCRASWRPETASDT